MKCACLSDHSLKLCMSKGLNITKFSRSCISLTHSLCVFQPIVTAIALGKLVSRQSRAWSVRGWTSRAAWVWPVPKLGWRTKPSVSTATILNNVMICRNQVQQNLITVCPFRFTYRYILWCLRGDSHPTIASRCVLKYGSFHFISCCLILFPAKNEMKWMVFKAIVLYL